MKKVIVLGIGCAKCKALLERVQKVIEENKIVADVEKITDLNVMMGYGIISMPGLVIDGKVVSSGTIPREIDILTLLK